MMKKYAGKVLAAAMAVSMMVPMAGTSVLAADTNTTSGNTTVDYTVQEKYTWTVPTEVTFTSDALTQTNTADEGVKITQNVINSGKKLSIKIQDGQEFTINANAEGKKDATLKLEMKYFLLMLELTQHLLQ